MDNIKPFDIKKINPGSKVLIVGVRATGKTTLAKQLCKNISPNVLLDYSPYNPIIIDNVIMNNSTAIVTIQHPFCTSLEQSSYFDFVFIFYRDNVQYRESLYKRYANIFPSFKSFEEAMDKYAGNYNCIVINNSSKSEELSDRVFVYKATI